MKYIIIVIYLIVLSLTPLPSGDFISLNEGVRTFSFDADRARPFTNVTL